MSIPLCRNNFVATSSICLLTLWVSCAVTRAQTDLVIRGEYKPGKLESFLVANPRATLVKRQLGKFDGPTTATFTAIVASDSVTKAKLPGLEVRFQGADQMIVYLDDDCIKRLQRAVASLQQSQLFEEEHRIEKKPCGPCDSACGRHVQ